VSSLSWEEITRRFTEAHNWWVSTSGDSGPHAVPVWGVVVREALHCSGDPGAVRSRNLAADPRLVVHLEIAGVTAPL
jgi:hypothetical protein